MKSVATISISLEPGLVEALDAVAKSAGSRSAAVRQLLAEHQEALIQRAREKAYQEYYARPGVAEADLRLTEELMPALSWPEAEGAEHASRKGSARRSVPARPVAAGRRAAKVAAGGGGAE